MKITFLGTGTSQGLPVINCNCKTCLSTNPHDNRLRCSIHISWHNRHIVIDTGPDFRQQMLRYGIDQLDTILYTHEHYDHTAGIDDIRPYYFKNQKPIEVFLSQRVLEEFQKRFAYIFYNSEYYGVPKVNTTVVDHGDRIPVGLDNFIQVLSISHGTLPILGYRIGNFAYLTDVSMIEDRSLEQLIDLDTLVISALQKEEHHSHLNLDEALGYINILKPSQAYLIHMSHRLGPVKEWSLDLPINVKAAYDGLVLEI